MFDGNTRSSGTPLLAGNSIQPAKNFIRRLAHKICTAAAHGDCCGNLSWQSAENLPFWVTIRMGMSGSASFAPKVCGSWTSESVKQSRNGSTVCSGGYLGHFRHTMTTINEAPFNLTLHRRKFAPVRARAVPCAGEDHPGADPTADCRIVDAS